MPNDGIRLKIILIIEVRKLEFTDFDSHSRIISSIRILNRTDYPCFDFNLNDVIHRIFLQYNIL